nr:hypothetical transcript [Hymenolepis microstoma]
MMEESLIAKSHLDDTGYLTSEPVSQLQISNFVMNKCECKSIGEEIVDALNEFSVYEEINEAKISGAEEKEVIQNEDVPFEQSPIPHVERIINMPRFHIKKYILDCDRRLLVAFLCIILIFFAWSKVKVSPLPCPLRIYHHRCYNTDYHKVA